MRFFIVRHGETVWNVEGRFQGQRDTELNERGLSQADKVAEYLARSMSGKFEAVITSPLSRAAVTAGKIAKACRCGNLDTEPDFTEINHGDWEGMLSSEVNKRWPRLLDLWHTSPHEVLMPGDGGEALRDVQNRALGALRRALSLYANDVCVVAHDAVIKAVLCSVLNAPLSSFWNFQIANCSVSIAEVRDATFRVSLMGDAHFLGEGFDLPEQTGL